MKILLVNNFFCSVGGAENSTYKTGLVLKAKGHEVFFFATDKKPYFQENYEYSKYFPQYHNFSDLTLKELSKYILNPVYFYNFEAKEKLDLYLKHIKPDIVHLNCISYYLSPSVISACVENNVPVVMTIRDPFIACPNTGLMFKSQAYCNSQLCVSGNSIHCILNKCNDKSLFKSIVSASEFSFRKLHKLYDKVSAFIGTSDAIVNLALKSGLSENKLSLVNNFIDDKFLNIEPEFTNKGYFLYAGRLAKEKGVIHLLKAMNKLPDINLHIVGTGPEEGELISFVRRLNMKNITFLGFKKGQELLDEYKGCIASIIPSNYFEAFGMTILESFAHGKPVIGSHIGGIPELINNGLDGFTFELGNVNQLADIIKFLNANNQLVIQMGINGRKKAESLYNSEIYYSKLLKVYNSVLKVENINESFTYK